MAPTDDQALQFAVMLQAGLPSSDAIQYFTDSSDPGELANLLNSWLRSRALKRAQVQLMGKAWQDMTLNERINYALDLHYNSLAYFLYSHNYAEVGQSDKAKADTARGALEAKLAGLAGKGDALTRFMEDFVSGKLQGKLLGRPVGLS